MQVWELELYFYPSAGGLKKKEDKKIGASSYHGVYAFAVAMGLVELACLRDVAFS